MKCSIGSFVAVSLAILCHYYAKKKEPKMQSEKVR